MVPEDCNHSASVSFRNYTKPTVDSWRGVSDYIKNKQMGRTLMGCLKVIAESIIWSQKHPWSIYALTSSDVNLTTKEIYTCVTLVIAFWMFYVVSLVRITMVVGYVVAFLLIKPSSCPLVVRYGIVGSMLQADSCPSSHYWKIWWGMFVTELHCSPWSTPTAQTLWSWRVCCDFTHTHSVATSH